MNSIIVLKSRVTNMSSETKSEIRRMAKSYVESLVITVAVCGTLVAAQALVNAANDAVQERKENQPQSNEEVLEMKF